LFVFQVFYAIFCRLFSKLNNKLATYLVQVTALSGFTLFRNTSTKYGKHISLNVEIKGTIPANTWTVIGTVSAENKPHDTLSTSCIITDNGSFCGMVAIYNNGTINVFTTSAISDKTIGLAIDYNLMS